MKYLIVLLVLSFTLQAEDAKPQPLEVSQAMAALEKSIVAARKVYDPIVAKAVADAVLKLNQVKADYMKKSDLEGANMIVDAIAKLKEGNVVSEIEEHVKSMNNMKLFADCGIVGKWNMSGYIYDLKNNGSASFNGEHQGSKWMVNNNKLIISWDTGYVDTFILPIKNNTLSGTNQVGTKLSMTRLPSTK